MRDLTFTPAVELAKLYRTRKEVLGDIIGAQPVYVKAPFADYTDAGYNAFKTTGVASTR